MIRLASVTMCFRLLRLLSLRSLSVGTALGFCTACSTPDPTPASRTVPPRVVAAVAVDEKKVDAVTPAVVLSAPASPAPRSRPVKGEAASSLALKRFVVTTGVKDREPVAETDALVANGSAIYAFAELSNPVGGSENVRITFERKGGAERVGNVTLPVPGQVSRHRTWAVTRFIRAAGVWDAVLWSESGAELGRTSFEVSAS